MLVGTGYQYLSGEGVFSLDTFYGRLDEHGKRLQGLRVDAAQSRGQWSVTKQDTDELGTEAQNSASSQHPIQPTFDCGKARKPTEVEICSNQDLAALEVNMVNAYQQVSKQLVKSEVADFRQWHLDWFKRYQNTCNSNALGSQNLRDCISREMVEHTNDLKSGLN